MAEVWPSLQATALAQAHPSWFEGFEPDLLEQARQSQYGRRLLARDLARHGAPTLFSSIPAAVPHALSSEDWLQLARDPLDTLLLDLAAIAFASAIRACINRADVLRLRRVLGEPRYSLALRHTQSAGEYAEAIHADLSRSMISDDALLETLRARGRLELMTTAVAAHPAAVERLRLHDSSAARQATGQAWLSTAQVRSATQHVRTSSTVTLNGAEVATHA